MTDPFVHLHVASGYSLRYGAAHPHVLVERAVDHGMTLLGLTDRDGVYGAVKFAKACAQAGIRPVLGVDLAVASAETAARPASPSASAAPRVPATPARGGVFRDAGHPRVTLLAQQGKAGWASICRVVSATHLSGERGVPVSSPEILRAQLESAPGTLAVLLGPDSDVGRAVAARRRDLAEAALRRWLHIVPRHDLFLEIVSHRGPGDSARAARLAGFAADNRVEAVLTNAVRYVDRADAPVADVLDAARRLVALDQRHVDRSTGEGYLKSGKEMAEVAHEIARYAGTGDRGASALLARTALLAERCALDPRRDLGIGEVHFPELSHVAGKDPSGQAADAGTELRKRCEAGISRRGLADTPPVRERLDAELDVIGALGYPTYFLTVADITDLIRRKGVRCAARGSGAGSLVNYLLGISDVDPMRYRLLMERFLSPLRTQLPDIDIDVESARRTEIYQAILDRYGADRCSCVAMMDTYRARHAIRDVGAALGLPLTEIDAIAKAFPHIRANQVRAALRDLPELRASGLSAERLDLLLRLVERLDGLPRHIALHPCGVLLSDATMLDRTPVEASFLGFPMSQFDKDDVEDLGLLKLDVLGVRMQSAIAHALQEVERVDGVQVDIDAIPRDDPAAFQLIQSTRTLGCFQIESPGQRELIGKFAPETFDDLIIDISLFRPGPVKSDMVTPFLEARQGWRAPRYLHPDLVPALEQTRGVVVFHEQVLEIVATMTGCTLAEADEVRRALGDPAGQADVEVWFRPRALGLGYSLEVVDAAWEVLRAFASFGFCKAHAAAFALPTYQSAWLKAHHPAAFLAGVLTHDPGMYPKRLILDDARQFGIAILPLDVNVSDASYRVERIAAFDEPPPEILGAPARAVPEAPLPDGREYGIRLGLSDVKGISEAEVTGILAGRPYASLADFWYRADVSRPIVERLVLAGAFDSVYGLGSRVPVRRRGQVSRRDLLLQVAELDAWRRLSSRTSRQRRRGGDLAPRDAQHAPAAGPPDPVRLDPRRSAARQSRAPRAVDPPDVQLALDLADAGFEPRATPSGLPEMSGAERVRAELDVLGLDATRHVLDFYTPLLDALGVTRARDLLTRRARADVLVAGVKVATQTPPVRSGRRVVFVTLDDSTGPIDATLFEDAQAAYAATVFHSWLLVVHGRIRRTGPRGISLQALACWELPALFEIWREQGTTGVQEAMARAPQPVATEEAVHGAAGSRSTRPVLAAPPVQHATGFQQSQWADIRPAGDSPRAAPRRLWHASSGSAG